MKEILLKYIEYLERKRKSRDLWKLIKEESITIDACVKFWRQNKQPGDAEYAANQVLAVKQRIEKLKNQIKLL